MNPNMPSSGRVDVIATKSPLLTLLCALDDAASFKHGTPAWRIAVAKANVYLRDNADQVRLSIRGHLGIATITEPQS